MIPNLRTMHHIVAMGMLSLFIHFQASRTSAQTIATGRAAALLPPVPGLAKASATPQTIPIKEEDLKTIPVISRASPEETFGNTPLPNHTKQYPPTFSSTQKQNTLIGKSINWTRSISDAVLPTSQNDGSNTTKVPQVTYRHSEERNPSPFNPNVVVRPTIVPNAPSTIPNNTQQTMPQNTTSDVPQPGSPAWKWYGYGSPVPGQNPNAPSGQYNPAAGNWMMANKATPGAIPDSGMVSPNQAMTTTPPQYAEPLVKQQPQFVLEAVPPTNPNNIQSPPGNLVLPPTPKATLDNTVRPIRYSTSGPVSQMGSPTNNSNLIIPSVTRGQIPYQQPVVRQQPLGNSVAEITRFQIQEQIGPITDLNVIQKSGNSMLIQFTVHRHADAEATVNRIAAIPDLRPWRIDFDVSVRR